MKTVVVIRDIGDEKQQLGVCYVIDGKKVIFKSESIERGWVDNKKNVSCVPAEMYPLKKEYSSRFKKELWELKDVEGRSECKFHAANYARQLNGCIALGETRVDIDKDGYYDVTNSRETMRKFHKAMGNDRDAVIIIEDLIKFDEYEKEI